MLDRVILGMDFLAAMGSRIQCGGAALKVKLGPSAEDPRLRPSKIDLMSSEDTNPGALEEWSTKVPKRQQSGDKGTTYTERSEAPAHKRIMRQMTALKWTNCFAKMPSNRTAQLNAHSVPDAYPVPRINHILEILRQARFISTLDLKHGYWQIPMAKDSRQFTAFTVPGRGLYQWKFMPFELLSASATFQRALDSMFGADMEPFAFAYLDDIIVIGATEEQDLANLAEVFRRLRRANLKVNPKKCAFFRRRLVYLGHVISAEGVQTDPVKVTAITNLKPLTCLKELRQCLGMASWYRRFVPNFASVVQPMTALLKKGRKLAWSHEQQNALDEVKRSLTTALVLGCPDFDKTFVLQTDASDVGLGAVLSQDIEGLEKVIAHASRRLTATDGNYTTTEKECLVIIWAIRKMRCYLEGYRLEVVTDHLALKWLNSIESPSGRITRWALELQQFKFDVRYRRGKLNVVATTTDNPLMSCNRPPKWRHPVDGSKGTELMTRTTSRENCASLAHAESESYENVSTRPRLGIWGSERPFLDCLRGETMIARLTEGDQSSWDELLPEIALAINASVSDSTGFSPAFLTQGREPRLPTMLYDEVTPGSAVIAKDPEERRSANISQLEPYYTEDVENAAAEEGNETIQGDDSREQAGWKDTPRMAAKMKRRRTTAQRLGLRACGGDKPLDPRQLTTSKTSPPSRATLTSAPSLAPWPRRDPRAGHTRYTESSRRPSIEHTYHRMVEGQVCHWEGRASMMCIEVKSITIEAPWIRAGSLYVDEPPSPPPPPALG
ncbi:uncharacterized protein [Drosophila suzukii]|uniref:Reverse transcriptase domain-containing protein n=1 Tax=Drosophila suzukii TaxID=28584 RepID=A0ABM4TNE7_DROSZ